MNEMTLIGLCLFITLSTLCFLPFVVMGWLASKQVEAWVLMHDDGIQPLRKD